MELLQQRDKLFNDWLGFIRQVLLGLEKTNISSRTPYRSQHVIILSLLSIILRRVFWAISWRCQQRGSVTSDKNMHKCWIGKGVGGSGHGLIEVLFQHLSGGTEENHKNLSQDSRCSGWYLIREHPECKYIDLPLCQPAHYCADQRISRNWTLWNFNWQQSTNSQVVCSSCLLYNHFARSE
jgi:hypothetical protein